MTSEQLRKIDALVAEYVMEVPVKEEWGEKAFWVYEPSPKGTREAPGYKWYREGTLGLRDCLPRYSTNISAAWGVVEKMRTEMFSFYLMDCAGQGSWEANFDTKADQIYCHMHESASLAICLAALKAKGIDYETDV